jgi:pimeloyl-ACP methyl ester carboxylesterase
VSDRYAALIPQARIERVPGAGHAVAVEQPDALADLIANHIESAA